ncbi:galactoside alpha-(1,2)-fucosyltransferase 1-like isoform X1 [Babylonia areolata]|uniref:galactoside alpha-(1,2)-fucosyltransferase 1-like isoform X1 n=1 Tax=Babylonia areolata TaxID=304850 RepID=UPI003FD02C96
MANCCVRRQVFLAATALVLILSAYLIAPKLHVWAPLTSQDNSTVISVRAEHNRFSGTNVTVLIPPDSAFPHNASRNQGHSRTRVNENIQPWWDPHKRYLLRSFEGRLGNVLFQLSSALCIATLNNLTLIIQDDRWIRSLQYSGARVPAAAWSTLKIPKVVHHSLTLSGTFEPSFMVLEPRNCSHSLSGYFQSWRYFQPCQAEVRQATRFNDSIIADAARIVTGLREKLPNRTLVGVHVRRGDYLKPEEVKVGRRMAPADYFLRAMTYFRDRFPNVTFVVLSQDPDWFRVQVTSAGDVIMQSLSATPEVDMELLSRMDHLIISVGTFSWWSAYKSKGSVVYYKDFRAPGSVFAQKFQNITDFFLPEWIPM